MNPMGWDSSACYAAADMSTDRHEAGDMKDKVQCGVYMLRY